MGNWCAAEHYLYLHKGDYRANGPYCVVQHPLQAVSYHTLLKILCIELFVDGWLPNHKQWKCSPANLSLCYVAILANNCRESYLICVSDIV